MTRAAVWLSGLGAFLAAVTLVAAPQVGGKPTTGNPTPGTAQPDSPNLSDRVTLSGCLRQAAAGAQARGEAPDSNSTSNARFVLANAERVERVPPGTGGSQLAVNTSSRTFRLEGLDSQFSPFVGAKVEVSGEIKPRGSTTGATDVNSPTLVVEFVQRIASRC